MVHYFFHYIFSFNSQQEENILIPFYNQDDCFELKQWETDLKSIFEHLFTHIAKFHNQSQREFNEVFFFFLTAKI